MPCSFCGGDGEYIGSLGSVDWYRCRNCGAQFMHEVRRRARRRARKTRMEENPLPENAFKGRAKDRRILAHRAKKSGVKSIPPRNFSNSGLVAANREAEIREDENWAGRLEREYIRRGLKTNPRRRDRGRRNPAHRVIERDRLPDGFVELAKTGRKYSVLRGYSEWMKPPDIYDGLSGQEAEKRYAEILRAEVMDRNPRRRGRGRRNPGPSDAEIRAAEKIKGVEPWMFDHEEFWTALRKYKEFHGKYPDKIQGKQVPGVKDESFLVGMGKAMDVTYKPTDKKSSKYGSAYIHEFCDNLSRKPKDSELPDRACSADGKTIVTYGGKFGVRDWVRG